MVYSNCVSLTSYIPKSSTARLTPICRRPGQPSLNKRRHNLINIVCCILLEGILARDQVAVEDNQLRSLVVEDGLHHFESVDILEGTPICVLCLAEMEILKDGDLEGAAVGKLEGGPCDHWLADLKQEGRQAKRCQAVESCHFCVIGGSSCLGSDEEKL